MSNSNEKKVTRRPASVSRPMHLQALHMAADMQHCAILNHVREIDNLLRPMEDGQLLEDFQSDVAEARDRVSQLMKYIDGLHEKIGEAYQVGIEALRDSGFMQGDANVLMAGMVNGEPNVKPLRSEQNGLGFSVATQAGWVEMDEEPGTISAREPKE